MPVDTQRIKNFNENLKSAKAKSAKIDAEIEFNSKEIDTLCKELSADIGRQITPENAEAVLNELNAELMNTLEVGESILNRISEEERALANNANLSMQTGGQVGMTAQPMNTGVQAGVLNNTNGQEMPMMQPQVTQAGNGAGMQFGLPGMQTTNIGSVSGMNPNMAQQNVNGMQPNMAQQAINGMMPQSNVRQPIPGIPGMGAQMQQTSAPVTGQAVYGTIPGMVPQVQNGEQEEVTIPNMFGTPIVEL